MKNFKRDIYNSLQQWMRKKSSKPLLLLGARQVGKTSIVLEFAKKEFENYVVLNFEENPKLISLFEEDLNPQKLINKLELVFETKINPQNTLIFFDEVQAAPRALTSLKYFCEFKQDIKIVSAGSLLGVELSESSYPVGKVEILNMYPMCFSEYLEALGQAKLNDYLDETIYESHKKEVSLKIPEAIHFKLWEYFRYYLYSGGLPDVVKSSVSGPETFDFNSVSVSKANLIKSYISDIAKHSGKINALKVRRVFENIPFQLARTQEENVKKFKFKGVLGKKGSYREIAEPIDWLSSAGLSLKVPIVEKPRTPLKFEQKENTFKLYVFDVGILAELSSLTAKEILTYNFGSYKGYVAENFVLQELKKQFEDDIFSWSKNQAEVEFLLQAEGDVIPIEVKSGTNTRSKSLSSFIKRYDPYRAILTSGKTEINVLSKGLSRTPLYAISKVTTKLVEG